MRHAARWMRYGLTPALIFSLAACGSTQPKNAHVAIEQATHTVLYNPHSASLPQSEAYALGVFVQSVPASAVRNVEFDVDMNTPAGVLRARAMRDYLIHQGISGNRVQLHNTESEEPVATLTLQYAKGLPPEPCPDWSSNSQSNYSNADFSNFGCATNGDIAIEVADPEDLESGHGRPTYDSLREGVYLQKYMSGAAAATGGATSSAPVGGASATSP